MKLRLFLTFILFVTVPSVTLAQKKDTASKTSAYFSAGFGASIATGGFASLATASLGGDATRGTCEYISAGLIIKKLKFGFAIKEGWFTSSFNTGRYLQSAQAADTAPNKTFTQQGGGTKYNGGYGMLGLITDIKIHRCIIEFRLLGGELTYVFPEVIYSVSGPHMAPSPVYDFLSTESSAFAFEAGVNARLPFTKHFGAMIDIGYLHSSFAYGTEEQYTDGSGTLQQAGVYYSCTLSFLSMVAGLVYQF